MNLPVAELKAKSRYIRKNLLRMCVGARTGHVTSSLSCVDLLVALYYGGVLRYDTANPRWKDRDRFVLSKGQASPALYAILGNLGFFDEKEIERFGRKNGMFSVHLQNNVPGVEITSGSIGQGFGIAAGIALCAKMNRELFLTFVMIGDGECYEGPVWEAALFASHHNLNNLVAILDRNYLCATDFTENLLALEPLDDKWRAFGWDVLRIDGHSFEAILAALAAVRSRRSKKPLIIIADTVKGKGIPSISDIPLWHGIAPSAADAEKCLRELERT